MVKEINILEKIQRKAVRFLRGDYRSREPNCVIHMLKELEIPPLQQTRKENRLCLRFKIADSLVIAIPPDTYLKPLKVKEKKKEN